MQRLGRASGVRRAGGCATTALSLAGMQRADPTVAFSVETIVEFAIAHKSSGMKMVNSEAWKGKLPELQERNRWGKVFGSMSAAMASLLDASFEIPDVNIWVDPSGRKWQLDFDAPMFVPVLRQVPDHYMQINAWHRARDHTFGESSGVSPDLIPGKARLRQAVQHGNFQEVYFLGAMLQGAMDLHSEAS